MEILLLKNILDRLSSNKGFPNYQAERRIDIFINHFLDRILTKYLKTKTEFVCPEFPIKKSGNNLSTKLDYLCKTDTEIIFVELKTDSGSYKDEQAEIYLNNNWSKYISDYKLLAEVKRSKIDSEKYETLNSKLKDHKILNEEINFPIRVIYLSPMKTKQKKNSKVSNRIDIIRPINLCELTIDLNDAEQIVWDFLVKLEMYVYEIKHNETAL